MRANEIPQLKPGEFALDAKPPTVTAKACYSRHRRDDVQPILPSLAESLRKHLGGKDTTEAAFRMPDRTNLARMLRADLRDAEIDPTDESGQTTDFHALRHTYISLMARAGVAPKLLMDLARHSDVNLTMRFYSHTVVEDRAEALKALPDFGRTPEASPPVAATGTCDTKPLPGDWRGQNAKQSDKCDDECAQVTGPCRIRTCDQGIMSPLLYR